MQLTSVYCKANFIKNALCKKRITQRTPVAVGFWER